MLPNVKLWKKSFKVVILGDTGVGKTSIIFRYLDKLCVNTNPTIGAGFFTKIENADNKYNIKLEIWDTAGQERYHSITPLYYRNAYVSIIVYDISDPESFIKTKQWVKELQCSNSRKTTTIIIVGNKTDKLQNSMKNNLIETAEIFAKDNQLLHILASSKTNENIRKLFKIAASEIYNCLSGNEIIDWLNLFSEELTSMSSAISFGLNFNLTCIFDAVLDFIL